jgi:5-methylcytosine-specific restriction endonuclease McrA
MELSFVMKKPFDKTEIYIKAAFRRIWRWSKARRECLKAAKGRCVLCKQKAKKLYADHVKPVVPVKGLVIIHDNIFNLHHIDYNELFERMFYGELQAICKVCHSTKTKEENKQRQEFKKRKL